MVDSNVLQLCSSQGYSGCACVILFNDYVIILFFLPLVFVGHTLLSFFHLVCFPVLIASTEVLMFPL